MFRAYLSPIIRKYTVYIQQLVCVVLHISKLSASDSLVLHSTEYPLYNNINSSKINYHTSLQPPLLSRNSVATPSQIQASAMFYCRVNVLRNVKLMSHWNKALKYGAQHIPIAVYTCIYMMYTVHLLMMGYKHPSNL